MIGIHTHSHHLGRCRQSRRHPCCRHRRRRPLRVVVTVAVGAIVVILKVVFIIVMVEGAATATAVNATTISGISDYQDLCKGYITISAAPVQHGCNCLKLTELAVLLLTSNVGQRLHSPVQRPR